MSDSTKQGASKKMVMIVDDHPLFREGLKALIQRSKGFAVFDEAGSGRDACKRLTPDVPVDLVTVDLSLPDINGIEVIKKISSKTNIPIVVITMHARADLINNAFEAGAKAYITKEATSDRLMEAFNTVLDGNSFLDPKLSSLVIERLVGLGNKSQPKESVSDKRYSRLTPREQQVLRLVAEGLTSKEIAQQLSIKAKTVENHRSHLMEKLGLRNRVELVRYAVRLGIVEI